MNRIVDQTYCINLKTSQERRQQMIKEFERHHISFKFINAVEVGHKECQMVLKTKTENRVKQRCYCREKCRHRARRLRPVEVAIALSHYNVYQDMIAHDYDLALVCEDDIVFHPRFNEIITDLFTSDKIDQLLSDTPYIVFLGGRRDNPNLERTDQQLLRSKTGSYSNYCYLINYSATKKLVEDFFPIQRPEDSYKRYLINQESIKCYQMVPSLIGELSTGVNLRPIYSRLSR